MTQHWPSMRPVERAAAVIDLRDAGNRKEEIAAALAITTDELVAFCVEERISGVTNRTLPKSWFHSLSVEERGAYVRRRISESATPQAIAEDAQITLEALRRFCWDHGIRGLSNRAVDVAARHACVPDDRMVDPKAWVPLAPAVDLLTVADGCRWPVEQDGKQMCCGLPRAGRGSYCEHHKKLAYGGGR